MEFVLEVVAGGTHSGGEESAPVLLRELQEEGVHETWRRKVGDWRDLRLIDVLVFVSSSF